MPKFRETGVGSQAWYIKQVKENPEKRGFTYIRWSATEQGRALQFDEVSEAIDELVNSGHLKRIAKPDAPKSTRYEVTSFGHRYLEQHKDEATGIKAGPIESGRTGSTAAPGIGVSHTVPQNPGLIRSLPIAPEPDEPEIVVPIPPKPDRPIDRVAKAGISLGQEIERHNAKAKPEPAKESTPTPVPIQKSPNKGSSDSLIDQLKLAAGALALEKFAEQITVKDLLDYMEKTS